MTRQSRCALAYYYLCATIAFTCTSCNGFISHTTTQHRLRSPWQIQQSNSQRSKSSLCMDPHSNRARIDKNLEDLMGDDWRQFRAGLVKQEQTDQTLLFAQQKQQQKNQQRRNPMAFPPNSEDQQHLQQENLGKMFTTAISSIFSQKSQQRDEIKEDQQAVFADDDSGEILCGIGGSTEPCSDPFEESDAQFYIPPDVEQVSFDKERWAHPLSHIEPGCVLIANEHLGGVFHHTVVLIIDHHDKAGSTGIVINRPQGKLLKIANDQSSNVDASLKLAFKNATVSYGGPVMPEEFSILHGFGQVQDSKRVGSGVFIGGSRELMEEVRIGQFSPNEALFAYGRAAWVPQQLGREISKGVWYIASACDSFVLRNAGAEQCPQDTDDLWFDVLNSMGGEYADIANTWKATSSSPTTHS